MSERDEEERVDERAEEPASEAEAREVSGDAAAIPSPHEVSRHDCDDGVAKLLADLKVCDQKQEFTRSRDGHRI